MNNTKTVALNRRSTFARLLVTLLAVLILTGCQEQLYTGLGEQDANEMLALLLDRGIDANKAAGEKGTWNVTVERSQIARSMDLLRSNGLPRTQYMNMGEIFKKEGIISSPLEERARFLFALSQEVSGTIAEIDGVLAARVHIVLPEDDGLGEKMTPSSASVFIKYRNAIPLQRDVQKIKKLVENSIPGLGYDAISVFLFPAEEREPQAVRQYARVLGIRVAPGSENSVIVLLVFCLILLAGLGYCGWRIWLKQKPEDMGADTSDMEM
ncbi:MAG: type III secretion inner membrane ring lipoprotein SctJ [Desulfovibrionales bacterium]|nr:type III secretion inner membrane ring lipoprotein SctJ [Desulfovibrionales bacterium]